MHFANIPTWDQWARASSSFLKSRTGPTKQHLSRVDDLVKKYYQVHDQGKLNILMALKDAIVDWEDDKIERGVGSGRKEAMAALMEVVLRKLRELDGWGKHRYLKACCIGYLVGTGGYDNTRGPAAWDTRNREESADLTDRILKLKSAIIDAFSSYTHYKKANNIQANESKTILKIFMAPEFYFRGPYGAYQDIGWNNRIMSEMRDETSSEIYRDWLFVLGTAVFSTDKEEKQGNKMVKVGNLLENYALVQKGGPKTAEHRDLIVAKEFPSHVDFKPEEYWKNLQRFPDPKKKFNKDVDNWYNPSTSEAVVGGQMEKRIMVPGAREDPHFSGPPKDSVSELVGGTIFTMDGITFGLEVCRDHLLRRLNQSKESGKVLIQLIPSCGAWIKSDGIACISNGIVFNVDGAAQGKSDALVRDPSRAPGRTLDAVSYSPRGKIIAIHTPATIPWPHTISAKPGRLRRAAEVH